MYTSISIRNKNISVQLQENRVCIISDENLAALVTEMPEAATDELVNLIKEKFHARFNKDLGIANASMAVEIWGHVFAEKFADAVKVITPLKFVNALAEKIYLHCEVINIGNKDHDRNRFVWDWLAAFKPALAAMLLKAG